MQDLLSILLKIKERIRDSGIEHSFQMNNFLNLDQQLHVYDSYVIDVAGLGGAADGYDVEHVGICDAGLLKIFLIFSNLGYF